MKMLAPAHCLLFLLALVGTLGCGPTITPTATPVPVTIMVTAAGKPVTNVTMTLQPMVAGGQAVGDVVNGQFSADVVPGTYTYYVDRGKTPADLAPIPAAYREGSLDRKLEIAAAGSYEVKLD